MPETLPVRELKRIVGSGNLFTAPEELVAYSYDATRAESLPWAVARPGSAAEVAAILQLANRDGFPVVPRGAGTGMSGGSVPVQGGVALSLERMDRIVEIDEENLLAVVQPGVVTGDLHREVEARGLFYPPDPASSQFCTIGGNVAENAGGLRAVKYGVTKDYVLGLEVVLPTGAIIRTGSRALKSVAGYDLTRLMVGSEGTLGVATEILLRLLPLPEAVRTAAAFYRDMEGAAGAVSRILKARIMPRTLEFVDSEALRSVERYLKQDISSGAAAMLLVEVDGTAQSAEQEISLIARILGDAGAVRVEQARDEQARERLWKARKSISPSLAGVKARKVSEDIAVPRSRIPHILGEIRGIAQKHGLLIVNFGHAGDGNIHTNILFDDQDAPKVETAVKDIFTAALRMGGSISGEHGIGLSKAAYLPMEAGPEALATMKRIKTALDPRGILNPGKIF